MAITLVGPEGLPKAGAYRQVAVATGSRLGETPAAPGTLVGVAALDVPEHLVEVEGTAVLD
ncbi:hypothetical protein EES44_28340 [Streptomyces sp. ADI96-15]|uniref:hypothetical protein n=1 Tax=unclassified Streptomyces TaxID=2593676 RepID=UPI0003C320E6|nr:MULTISPECIES: hypothetical protein [unclassified Streptomyces]ESP99349.1 Endoribonuclease L-PSP [Streptomyces sp. GBA 94-10 4N24]RPK55293.1 hypothetical protein EES44_28340 [Streptomyces sp. ADI96-15]UZN59857.1 Endoribonuclease L-PSP [Streptomyces sp. GBA 94-10 4N24]